MSPGSGYTYFNVHTNRALTEIEASSLIHLPRKELPGCPRRSWKYELRPSVWTVGSAQFPNPLEANGPDEWEIAVTAWGEVAVKGCAAGATVEPSNGKTTDGAVYNESGPVVLWMNINNDHFEGSVVHFFHREVSSGAEIGHIAGWVELPGYVCGLLNKGTTVVQ